MEIDKFRDSCLRKICLRKTIINDKCETLAKQENCYRKYMEKLEKSKALSDSPKTKPLKRTPLKTKLKRDARYNDFRNAVWRRETNMDMPPGGKVTDWKKYCQFWKCLSPEEQKQFTNFVKGKEWMLNTIEVAHIKGKGAFAELKYDPDNAVLCNHYSHSLLDIHKSPLTGEDITDEERTSWFRRMKEHNLKWKKIEEEVSKL